MGFTIAYNLDYILFGDHVEFQAKDIQRIAGIQKYRYEYLATKIGITPEIEEVDGTGHMHLYSFRNLLQFAFAHQAGGLGLSPKTIRHMLYFLKDYDELTESEIFKQDTSIALILYYIKLQDSIYFKVGGHKPQKADGSLDFGIVLKTETFLTYHDESGNRIIEWTRSGRDLNELLRNCEAFLAINLGVIKRKVIERIA